MISARHVHASVYVNTISGSVFEKVRQDDSDPIALEAYEKIAEQYAARIEWKAHNAYIDRPTVLSLLPEVDGKAVLDAGCGPGLYSKRLVELGASVTAVDVSPKMVEYAKSLLGDSADVFLHDLNKPLAFLGDGSMHLVVAPLVLDYILDWSALFDEFYRVLQDGGAFVFSVEHPWMKFLISGHEYYFKTERMEYLWTGFGEKVAMPSIRRPLNAMLEPIHDAGFLLDRIVEATPTEDCKHTFPETYEKTLRKPSFLCVRARK